MFLWAVIAIWAVRDGLQDIVDMDELSRAIEVLSPELEDLYILMLSRIKVACRRDAAHFLNLILCNIAGYYSKQVNLFMLYFSNQQRTLGDSPFVYKKITTSDLAEACHILRIRLLSHTGGFICLTSSRDDHDTHREREDSDTIMYKRVDFVHKSAQDFLGDNAEAKSFLALDLSSASQNHLAVARGRFSYLVYLANNEHRPKSSVETAYYTFRGALLQIARAESFVGAPQSALMQSLQYEKFIPNLPRRIIAYWEAFMVTANYSSPIDIVAMAASVGMLLYPCKQLGLSIHSEIYSPSLPDLEHYSRIKSTGETLSWRTPKDSQDRDIDILTRLRSASYRQALTELLQWKADDLYRSQAENQSKKVPCAEFYMLACCDVDRVELAAVLF